MLAMLVLATVIILWHNLYRQSQDAVGLPFSPHIYHELLFNLTSHGYQILRVSDYLYGNYSGKVVVIRHDVDGQNVRCGSLILSGIEKEFGVRSSFYLRVHSRPNYFEQNIQFFKNLEKEGYEIGLHYECLSRTDNTTLALRLLEAQVDYMRYFFNVTTVSAHGDGYNSSINNMDLWNQHPDEFERIGVAEAHGFQDTYICDTGGVLVIPDDWGRLVLVNFHADWWG